VNVLQEFVYRHFPEGLGGGVEEHGDLQPGICAQVLVKTGKQLSGCKVLIDEFKASNRCPQTGRKRTVHQLG
jgi:hypothetical protein